MILMIIPYYMGECITSHLVAIFFQGKQDDANDRFPDDNFLNNQADSFRAEFDFLQQDI
jgi:hypothetical protein